MSDPVSHSEIEDVLSSIRRLVSEEARVAPRPVGPAPALILTPDARVRDVAAPEPSDAANAEPAEAEVASDAAPEVQATADAQPENVWNEAASDRSFDADVARDASEPATADQQVEDLSANPVEDAFEDDDATLPPFASDRMARSGSESGLEGEADVESAAASSDIPDVAPSDPWITKEQVETPVDEAPEAAEEIAEPVFTHGTDNRSTLERAIADLENAVANSRADWEPEQDETGADHDNAPKAEEGPSLPADVLTSDTIEDAATDLAAQAALEALSEEMEAHWKAAPPPRLRDAQTQSLDTVIEDVQEGDGVNASDDQTVDMEYLAEADEAFELRAEGTSDPAQAEEADTLVQDGDAQEFVDLTDAEDEDTATALMAEDEPTAADVPFEDDVEDVDTAQSGAAFVPASDLDEDLKAGEIDVPKVDDQDAIAAADDAVEPSTDASSDAPSEEIAAVSWEPEPEAQTHWEPSDDVASDVSASEEDEVLEQDGDTLDDVDAEVLSELAAQGVIELGSSDALEVEDVDVAAAEAAVSDAQAPQEAADPWDGVLVTPPPQAPEAPAESEAAPQAADDLLPEVIDEDALRELVVSIVRQELQGPLGERITRNVRKLVRREISRVVESGPID